MKKIIYTILLFSFNVIAYASITDISFSTQSWTFSSGVIQSGNQIEITGSASSYEKATLTVDLPTNTSTFYLVADVYFSGIVCGDAAHKSPKFKLYKADGTKLQVLNFYNPLESRWCTSGMMVNKNNETTIIIEFDMYIR